MGKSRSTYTKGLWTHKETRSDAAGRSHLKPFRLVAGRFWKDERERVSEAEEEETEMLSCVTRRPGAASAANKTACWFGRVSLYPLGVVLYNQYRIIDQGQLHKT